MKKNITKEVLAGLTKLSEESSLFGYLAAKRMYRADCVCHLVNSPLISKNGDPSLPAPRALFIYRQQKLSGDISHTAVSGRKDSFPRREGTAKGDPAAGHLSGGRMPSLPDRSDSGLSP